MKVMSVQVKHFCLHTSRRVEEIAQLCDFVDALCSISTIAVFN